MTLNEECIAQLDLISPLIANQPASKSNTLLGHGKIKLGHKSGSISVQTSLANVTE